jgi:hypothetical protein
MNYPYSPQPKDYSYLTAAAATLNKGVEEIAAVEDAETKRKREAEELANLKTDLKTIEKAREDRIVEAASEYMEAAGLPNDDAGRRRAFAVAASTYYPPTGSERKDPSAAAVRLNSLDATWEKLLNKAKLERYRNETEGYTAKVNTPTLQQYGQGNVGVEDSGVQRTNAWPQSPQELVTQANDQALMAPPAVPAVSTEPTAQEKYDIARGIDPAILQNPTIAGDIGMSGKTELMAGDYPAGTTQEQVTREALKKPVVTGEMTTYANTYPKQKPPLSELDLAKIAKLRAEARKLAKEAEKGSTEVKVSDLTKLQKERNDITITLNQIDNKLLDPKKMDIEGGETIESLQQRKKDIEEQLPLLDNDIQEIRKRLEIPAVRENKTSKTQTIAKDIRAAVARLVPRRYTIGSNLGRETFLDKNKKGQARDDLYDNAVAMQVAQLAKQQGFDLPLDAIVNELKQSDLETIVDYILQQRQNGGTK